MPNHIIDSVRRTQRARWPDGNNWPDQWRLDDINIATNCDYNICDYRHPLYNNKNIKKQLTNVKTSADTNIFNIQRIHIGGHGI